MSDEASGGALVVSRLRIYPVKGGRGRDLDQMDFDHAGPVHDRRWMVVSEDGHFVTQRESPKLATLEASPTKVGLTLSGPGIAPLALPKPSGSPFTVQIWRSTVSAASVSPEADEWVSAFLGGAYRLVYLPDDTIRETDPAFAPGRRVTFADGYPALIVTEGSCSEVQRRAGRPLPLERFRPNIVVSGGEPHEEDRWRRFQLGGLQFEGVKLCARCKVTTVDQTDGTLDAETEPLRTLGRYRKIENGVFFGLNAVHQEPGRIRVGDPVHVLERGTVRAY
ncbi:MAG: MOSC domain-containing protein [Longimicrobiales bacterium]